jgi:hypothetical protein
MCVVIYLWCLRVHHGCFYIMEFAKITLIVMSACLFCGVLCSFLYDWYKDREWRRNNPDEHDIMNRKIKDDFTK